MGTNDYIDIDPNQYFDDGDFVPYLLMKDLLDEHNIIYVAEQGFYIFNDKYWERVNDNYICKLLHKKLGEKSKSSRVTETLNLVKFETNTPYEKLNKNRNRLVLLNGTVDISQWKQPIFYTDKFFEEDYCTLQLECNYNHEASYPVFNHFLETTFEGDSDIIAIVQEMMGYCLSTSTKFEKAFLFYGEGSNGKSVLLSVIEKLLTNKNISSVSLSDLTKQFSRFTLKDKLINISSEQENDLMDSSYFKKIVTGDVIDAADKFKPIFEFRPFCKMLFAMNKLPITKDRSHGYYRRLILIPFNRIFQKNEQDRSLNYKLESELDGIFQFALCGLKRLSEQDGFTESEKCNQLLYQYKKECNPIEQFFEEYIELDSSSHVISKELYQSYRSFCSEHGFNPVNDANFGKEVKRKYQIEKTRKKLKNGLNNVYEGLKIISTSEECSGF